MTQTSQYGLPTFEEIIDAYQKTGLVPCARSHYNYKGGAAPLTAVFLSKFSQSRIKDLTDGGGYIADMRKWQSNAFGIDTANLFDLGFDDPQWGEESNQQHILYGAEIRKKLQKAGYAI